MIAIAYRDKVVLERAFGVANLVTGEPLTPRHRFRVASHSKSFTAAGIMKLREQGKLRLDDPAGQFVDGLHRDGRTGHDRATALAQRGADPRRRRCRPVPRPPAVFQRTGARRGPQEAADHRARLALQILQPRLRAGRPDHRGDHRRAVPRLDHARDHRRRGPHRDRTRHAVAARHAVRARPQRTHPARPPRGDPGRQSRPTRSPPRRDSSAPPPISRASSHSCRRTRARACCRPQAGAKCRAGTGAIRMTAPEQYYGLGTISGSFDGWDWFGHSADCRATSRAPACTRRRT